VKSKKKKSAPSRSRRWLRRLAYLFSALVLIIILIRFGVILALPSIIESTAEDYGMHCSYERLDFSMLTGDLELWNLVIEPGEDGESFMDMEYCRADLAVSALFAGRLVVRRLEVDGMDLLLERDPDGTLPMLRHFKKKTEPEEVEPEDGEDAPSEALDLSLPLEINAIRLQHVHTRVRDASVSPPLDARFDFNLRISHVGAQTRRTRFELTLTSSPVLDAFTVEGTASASESELDATLTMEVRGFHPRHLRGYLAPMGLQPRAEALSFSAGARVQAQVVEERPDTARASLQVSEIRALADGQETFALHRFLVEAEHLGSNAPEISLVSVEGGRATASRDVEGVLCAAGFAFQGSSAEPEADPLSPSSSPEEPKELTWSIQTLAVRDLQARFLDQAVSPETVLAFHLDELKAQALDATPGSLPDRMALDARLNLPNVVEAIRIQGVTAPFAAHKTLDLQLSAEGIVPEALAPYLEEAGIESALKSGSLGFALHAAVEQEVEGRLAAEFHLDNLRFMDDGRELLGLDRIALSELEIAAESGRVSAKKIELSGTRCRVQIEGNGMLNALGFRFHEKESKGAAPPLPLELADLGFEITDFQWDPNPHTEAPTPAKIEVWLECPDLMERMTLSGSLLAKSNALSLDLALAGEGITAKAAIPYLAAAGITPLLEDGRLNLDLDGEILLEETGSIASISITDLAFEDSGTEWVDLDVLRVTNVRAMPGATRIEAVEIEQPRARVLRESDGSMVAAGFRFGMPAAKTAEETALPQPETEAEPSPEKEPSPFSLDRFRLNGAELFWLDRALTPAVETSAQLYFSMDSVVLGAEADPASFQAVFRVPDTLEQLSVEGTFSASSDRQGADLILQAQGLRAGRLEPYFPAGTRLTLKDGRFAARIEAEVNALDESGQKAKLAIRDVEYRDGEEGSPFLKADAIQVLVSRFDPEGKVIAVEEVSLAGLELDVRRSPDNETRLLGLALLPTVPKPDEESAVEAVETETPALQPKAPRRAAESLPLVTLEKLDLNVAEISFKDESGPDGPSNTRANLRFYNREPIRLLGEDPEGLPPTKLGLRVQIAPGLESFLLLIDTLPFAPEPTLQIEVEAQGINGKDLMALMPGMAEKIDGRGLTDGRLHGRLEGSVNVKRRHAMDFNLSKGFGLELLLKDWEFKNGAEGKTLIGLDELLLDVARVVPEAQKVHVRSLESVKPTAEISSEKDGLHLLGLVIKPQEEPATDPAPETKPQAEPVAAEQSKEDMPELRVDKIFVTDIDFSYQDNAVTPPMRLPLNQLDVEIRDFNSLALVEPRPFGFNVLIGADKAPLPKRSGSGGLFGTLGDAINGLAGGEEEEALEERTLFEEISLRGKLAVVPSLNGWVKAGVSALELANFRGSAEEAGVILDKGIFDTDLDLRFREDGSLDTQANFTFTDLSLSEPPDGPISQYLHLPAPLDVVIFLLRDEDGAINVPFNFEVKADGISAGSIAETAITTFGTLVANAIASSPFRVAGTLGDLVPLGGEEVEEGEQILAVTFDAGNVHLTRSMRRSMQRLVEQLKDEEETAVTLRHSLGQGDLKVAAKHANPGRQECLDLSHRLRQKRKEIAGDRAQLTAKARVAFAAGMYQKGIKATKRIRNLDREAGMTEQALDRVFELLRPGAERRAGRRTQGACIAIGQARLEAVRRELMESGIPDAENRIRLTRPKIDEKLAPSGGKVLASTSKRKKS